MEQLSFTLDAPRAIGRAAAELAQVRAERDEPGFSERARAHILAQLARHHEMSGEDLTDSCVAAGIVAKDGRAFGGIFAALVRGNLIRCVRADLPRARGHGTSGGRAWRLVR
jgi:hypothetical protein